jgi:DNA-binding Xre family transcriptional regulator
MTGKELHKILIDNKINFVELSAKLGLTPQALNSRFKTSDVTITFITEISEAINKNLYKYIFEAENMVNEPQEGYQLKPKKYIEERISELEQRLNALEKGKK